MPQLSIVKSEPLQIVSSEPTGQQQSVMEMGRESARSGQAEAPGFTEKFAEMLGPLAHPETLTDFARLLTLPVDSVRKALAGALTMAAAKASRAPVGNAVSAVGRGVESAGKAAEKPAGLGAVVEGITSHSPARAVAVAAAPKVVQMAGRGIQRAGQAIAGPIAAEAPAATAVAPAIAAAPVEASAAPSMSPQQIQNELGLAARRAGAKLTEPQYQQAAELVKQGQTPADAVKALAEPPPLSAAQVAKFRATGSEVKQYQDLIRAGKTHREAAGAIQAQREFAAKFGTPSPEQVKASVAHRNATGRWE